MPTIIGDSNVLWLLGVQAAQIAVLFLVAWCACRWLITNRPHLAHGLWVLLLIKCLTPPIWASDVGLFSWALDHSPNTVLIEGSTQSLGTVVDAPRVIREIKGKPSTNHTAPPAAVTVSKTAIAPETDPGMTAPQEPRIPWSLIILSMWTAGACAVLTSVLGRFIMLRRMIANSSLKHRGEWDQRLEDLRKRLGLWRRVRLVITREPIGPAVFGLIRQTIVLPEEITKDRSPCELEPILAHELIHVRRSDLWIGVLQLIVGAAWWFHPLVWLTIRRTSRTSEECCDLEVINALPDARRAYANLLLDVLARRQRWRTIPLVPGMRPADVTFRRMERIMTMKLKRNRWVVCLRWTALIAIAAVTLPGAARDGDAPAKAVTPVVAPNPVAKEAVSAGDQRDEEIVVIAYVLTKVYAQLEEAGIHRKGAQGLIKRLVLTQDFRVKTYDLTKLYMTGANSMAIDESQDDEATRRENAATIAFDEGMMIVRASLIVHERVERLLSAIAKHGLQQFRVSIKFGDVLESGWVSSLEWKSAGTIWQTTATPGEKAVRIETEAYRRFRYTMISSARLSKMTDQVEIVKLDDSLFAKFEVVVGGQSVKVGTEAVHTWTLPCSQCPSETKTWTIPYGQQALICVEPLEEEGDRRDQQETPAMLLHLSHVGAGIDDGEPGTRQSEDGQADSDERPQPYPRAYQGRWDTTLPITPGHTTLVMAKGPYGLYAFAITVERIPTEIWHHVGTDEFRIEPAD